MEIETNAKFSFQLNTFCIAVSDVLLVIIRMSLVELKSVVTEL